MQPVQWEGGSWLDGLAKKDGAKALSRAESFDTATAQLGKLSRTKNLIIEYEATGPYWLSLYEVHTHAGSRELVLKPLYVKAHRGTTRCTAT